jgi:hypothetical protein
MPCLSPGVSGAKEAYGIAVIKENKSVSIPPKALERYNLHNNDVVLLTSTREGECGFCILNIHKASETVFLKIIDKIKKIDEPIFIKSRPYAITDIKNEKIYFNNAILKAFELKPGDRFVIIKSTTLTISFNPIEIFKEKLRSHGFEDAVKNIDNLEVY